MKTLGVALKECRELKGFTLRQVEESIGVSNAYLSQLENEKIKKPSANVLYKLAQLYCVPLDSLLWAAGIIEEKPGELRQVIDMSILAAQKLSIEEEQALLDYLRFFRFLKK